jgi:hypothetical protein
MTSSPQSSSENTLDKTSKYKNNWIKDVDRMETPQAIKISQAIGTMTFEGNSGRDILGCEVVTAMMIQVEVFWVQTPCSDVVRVNMEAASLSETYITYNTTWHHNLDDFDL